jgi:hypothetical protein
MKIRKDEDGRIFINELSFPQFCMRLYGKNVLNKQTKQIIPRFVLFWSGLTFKEIENKYKLVERE